MYHISTESNKPDTKWMYEYTKELMQTQGLKIGDYNTIKDLIQRVIDLYHQAITKAYHIDNPRSSNQVIAYLKEISRRTAPDSVDEVYRICCNNGKWTSNAEALEELSKIGYQFADDMLMFRKYDGLLKGIKQLIKELDSNWTVHPTVSLGVTNRLQFSDPPIMSIPKKLLWYLVVPPEEGYSIYSVDIKNQEPGIMINALGMDELKPGLTDEGGMYEYMFKKALQPIARCNIAKSNQAKLWDNNKLDELRIVSPSLYCAVKPDSRNVFYNDERVVEIQQRYAEVDGDKVEGLPELPRTIRIATDCGCIYDVPVQWNIEKALKKGKLKFVKDLGEIEGTLEGLTLEIQSNERKQFKTSWLAYTYGGYKNTICANCKDINGERVYDFLTSIEALNDYKKLRDKAIKSGVENVRSVFGTLIHVDAPSRRMKERRMLDYPIQGSGSDILSLLMLHFNDEVEARGIKDDAKIYFTRHDEVVLLISNKLEDKIGNAGVIELLRDIFEHQIDDWTPFAIEITKADKDVVEHMIRQEIREDSIRIDYT